MTTAKRTLGEVTETAVGELHPHPRNPRTITDSALERLKRTMTEDREYLLVRPVVAMPDGTVVSGNQRLRAAREMGWDTVPAVFLKMTEEQARQRMIRDNTTSGSWEEESLAEILADMREGGSDLGLTGLEEDEIARVLATLRDADPKPLPDPDDAPPVPDNPTSVLGEVYELGRHRLICGDALDPEVLRKLVGTKRMHLVFTDPPYGVSYEGHPESTIAPEEREAGAKPKFEMIRGDDLRGKELRTFLRDAFFAGAKVARPSAAWYVWHASSTQALFEAALADCGYTVRNQLIWVKQKFTFSHAQYKWKHEPCFYAHRHGESVEWYGEDNESTIWEEAVETRGRVHGTQKPVALAERAIRNSAKEGGYVLDMFGGSGSTLIAAERTGRTCFMVELDEGFCDVIRTRYDQYVGGGNDR